MILVSAADAMAEGDGAFARPPSPFWSNLPASAAFAVSMALGCGVTGFFEAGAAA